MKEEEGKKLIQWLEQNHIDPAQAKELLRAIRDGKAREYSTFKHDFSGRHIKIGVLGDTHFGNKWTDKRFLRDVMSEFKREGVEAIYHTGDLTDGPWQRHRNVLEQYAHGIEAQVDDFVKDFPDVGVPVFCINGNHDNWYAKDGAGTVGRRVSELRKDITYLGADEAIVNIGKVRMMLSHPDDGSAYAYSYKAQKMVESMAKMGEKLPDIILQGHYHKLFFMNAAGLNYFCTGTTERQTPFMRGKKIAADIGAWILDIHRTRQGNLSKVGSQLLLYHGNKHEPAIK